MFHGAEFWSGFPEFSDDHSDSFTVERFNLMTCREISRLFTSSEDDPISKSPVTFETCFSCVLKLLCFFSEF